MLGRESALWPADWSKVKGDRPGPGCQYFSIPTVPKTERNPVLMVYVLLIWVAPR